MTNISHTYCPVGREYQKMVNMEDYYVIGAQKKGNFQCLVSWHPFHEAQCYSTNLHLGTFERAC